MSPDFVWTKIRSSSGRHRLTDTVRGATKTLRTDGTDAEFVHSNVTAFNSDGFDIGATGNASGSTYAAWAWDAGSSNTTIAAGSLNSSVYDQSQTWSSSSGIGTAANSFDGNLSTGGSVSSNGSAITVTTASFTASSISFYKNGNNDANLTTITVNGTAYTFPLQSTATGWVTVNLGSEVTVTSLTTTWYGGYTLYAVKADNKLLVDSGVSVPNVPSIASTVRANPSAGFSIASYTISTGVNSTIGHGLNTAPAVSICKLRNGSGDWYARFKGGSFDGYLLLNSTSAGSSQANTFTSTTLIPAYLGGSNEEWISYNFAPVEGYSAMGSYTGNGSADGPFVYTGFRPAWILYKRSDAAGNDWTILDATIGPTNVIDEYLQPSNSNAEASSTMFDFLSNGFKPRLTSAGHNASGGTYIYYAVAEHPFKTSRAR